MKRLAYFIIGLLAFSLVMVSCSSLPTPVAPLKITVATDASVPPFENYDLTSQKIEGLDIDFMNALAIKENLSPDYKNVSFGKLMTDMAQGKYDAAISAIIINNDHKGEMLFSDPYFPAGQIIVVKADNAAITGKDNLAGQVGVQTGTIGEIEVKKIKAAEAVSYDKISQAFLDLVTGKIQAVVCDNALALQYVNKNPDKFKLAGKVFTDENYGIVVAKGKTDLLDKINFGIKVLKNEGLIRQFSDKWLK